MTKKTPEEIEREIKLQEMELQKLVLVDLKLPASALWFEPPTIVRQVQLPRHRHFHFKLFGFVLSSSWYIIRSQMINFTMVNDDRK